MSTHHRPSGHAQQTAWELREPTPDEPDIGLNWLVRNTQSLRRRDDKPNLAAIGRLTGISYSALNAIIPARRDQRDFRRPDELTIGRVALVGAYLNDTTPEFAHSKIFHLPISPEAIAELDERLAELQATSGAHGELSAA